MQLFENEAEITEEERGRALQLEFELESHLTRLRMAIEPIRVASGQLPFEEFEAFQSLADPSAACETLDQCIARLEEQESRILAAASMQDASEDALYAELQKYQRETDLKIINQPIGIEINYAMQNAQKLVARSRKNSEQLPLIGQGDIKPIPGAEGEMVYEKVGEPPEESEGIFEDAQFYEFLLKLSAEQGGNLEELEKLLNLQRQRVGIKKEHLILTKNKSLDTTTQFKRIQGFMLPKRFMGDEQQVAVIRQSLFGAE